jgi:hypothetical protein
MTFRAVHCPQVGGTLAGRVEGDVKASAGSANIHIRDAVADRVDGNTTVALGKNATFSGAGSAGVSMAESLWVSSSYVGIESANSAELSSREVSATGTERVIVASLGSAVELVGTGDVEYIGFLWRSASSFDRFGERDC